MSNPANHDDGFADIDLMLYVDGEWRGDDGDDPHDPGDQADRIAEFIAADPAARTKIRALGEVSEVVSTYLELAADDVEPQLDAMWAAIEQRIQTNGAGERSPEAIPDAAPQATPQAVPAAAEGPAPVRIGIWSAIGRWLEAYRGHILTGAVAAAAVALVVIALRSPQTVIVERTAPPGHPIEPTSPGANPGSKLVNTTDPRPVPQVPDQPGPPEIESLEIRGGSGTVIMMPREGEDDISATVIFVETDVEGPL